MIKKIRKKRRRLHKIQTNPRAAPDQAETAIEVIGGIGTGAGTETITKTIKTIEAIIGNHPGQDRKSILKGKCAGSVLRTCP